MEEIQETGDYPLNVGVQRWVFRCNALDKTWANQRKMRREMLRRSDASMEITSDEVKDRKAGDTREENRESEAKKIKEATKKASERTEKGREGKCVRDLEDISATEAGNSFAAFPYNTEKNQNHCGNKQSMEACSFFVRVGAGTSFSSDLPADCIVFEMEWIEGDNKNDMYQLYQYFQNKIVKGL